MVCMVCSARNYDLRKSFMIDTVSTSHLNKKKLTAIIISLIYTLTTVFVPKVVSWTVGSSKVQEHGNVVLLVGSGPAERGLRCSRVLVLSHKGPGTSLSRTRPLVPRPGR